MALTTEQLLTIKTKIETDKVIPMKAIRELFPDENNSEVRKQLFGAYDRQELLAHSYVAPTPKTKEQKLAIIERNLSNVEKRKAKLLEEKVTTEAE